MKVFQNMAPCFYCLENSENSCSSCNNISYCSKQHFDIHKSTSGECFPVSIKFDQNCGKYCIATKDIKSFDVVLEDTAIAWGTYDDSKPLCLVCLKRADLTIKCEFCNLPMCGSKECMNSPVHTPECEVLRNHQPEKLEITGDHPVYALIAPLRILYKKYSKQECDIEAFEKVIRLESHLHDLKNGKSNT